jgi:hypothetical protein
MYVLLIVVLMHGTGKSAAIHETQFKNEKLCKSAKAEFDESMMRTYVTDTHSFCMKVK